MEEADGGPREMKARSFGAMGHPLNSRSTLRSRSVARAALSMGLKGTVEEMEYSVLQAVWLEKGSVYE